MLLHGNCLNTLQQLEANSVDSIVTDPPYGLGFMGKEWDNLPPGREVFEQCLRVLKPGGHLCCFGGSRTYHRMAVAVEDAGFEIRDQIMWVYGSGFPKSQDIGKAVDKLQGNEREYIETKDVGHDITNNAYRDGKTERKVKDITKGNSEWEGYGTALKPAHEPIVLARKPVEKGLSIAQNCLKWGVGAINVDGCRISIGENDPNDRSGTQINNKNKNNSVFGIGGTKRGSFQQGRFPANFIHDNSDEVVGLFPVTKSGALKPYSERHENASSYRMNRNKTFTQESNSGSAARFFYTAKAAKKERLTFNNHPTVKPVSLMQYLVRLITPEGGTCCDPFAGSGTTGLACMKEGRGYILIDSDKQSLDIARRRLLSEVVSAHWGQRKKRYQQKTAKKAALC